MVRFSVFLFLVGSASLFGTSAQQQMIRYILHCFSIVTAVCSCFLFKRVANYNGKDFVMWRPALRAACASFLFVVLFSVSSDFANCRRLCYLSFLYSNFLEG